MFLAIIPLTVLGSGSREEVGGSSSEPILGRAKCVFVFIGDGMGMPQISAAEAYLKDSVGDEVGFEKLSFSEFPAQGLTTTHAQDRFITDSAAASTAIACG